MGWRGSEGPGMVASARSGRTSRAGIAALLEVEQSLLGALAYDPDLVQAHEALAQHYRALHQTFEKRGPSQSTQRLEALLRTHAEALPPSHPEREDHQAYLRGDGVFDLVTNPPGARVTIYRYDVQCMRMVPEPVGVLGTTPLRNIRLETGSYLMVIEADGHERVTYPVYISRLHHWSGVRPGGDAPHAVWLPPKGSLQESERYIPGGWFWSGGDPEAIEPLPRRRLWIDGFVMSRDPVTNRQYLVFLNDLVANGQTELALHHAPTERAHAGATRGTLVYSRDSDGYFSVGTDADGDPWRLDDPVVQVDEEDAAAYVRWLSARRGRKVRLPSELEWEKQLVAWMVGPIRGVTCSIRLGVVC